MKEKYDYIIIGAGIYGLHAAQYLAKKKRKVLVLEADPKPFSRASYVNQARVHNGYHYPRSLSTALTSAKYYERFSKDFAFSINDKFEKIYALAADFSFCSAKNFDFFCQNANIPCEEVSTKKYFKDGAVEAAFLTKETAFDAIKIKKYLIDKIKNYKQVNVLYNSAVTDINELESEYLIECNSKKYYGEKVINATYASINQILQMAQLEKFKIKYELCEVILCDISSNLKDVGITVMDGPFFSVMPFGQTKYHSLTSVSFTPHKTSFNDLPKFECQTDNKNCSAVHLENCNECLVSPASAFPYMKQLANKYLHDDFEIIKRKSLFSIKSILLQSELDDSRPTMVKINNQSPGFYSILSGKINTIYDIEDILI